MSRTGSPSEFLSVCILFQEWNYDGISFNNSDLTQVIALCSKLKDINYLAPKPAAVTAYFVTNEEDISQDIDCWAGTWLSRWQVWMGAIWLEKCKIYVSKTFLSLPKK